MSSNSKTFTYEEVKKHNKHDDLWVVIHDKVYNLTSFISDHPGGELVLLEQGGEYATEAFEDVGHSLESREMMKEYCIGEIAHVKYYNFNIFRLTKRERANLLHHLHRSMWAALLIPFGVIFIAFGAYRYFGY